MHSLVDRRYAHRFVLIVGLAVAQTGAVEAQGQGGGDASCGMLDSANLHLTEHAYLFTDDAGADFRARNGIDLVSPSEVSLLDNANTCGKIVDKVEADAGTTYDPQWYAIYQFGDYYGMEVAVSSSAPGAQFLRGPSRLYVFKKQGIEFIILVVL